MKQTQVGGNFPSSMLLFDGKEAKGVIERNKLPFGAKYTEKGNYNPNLVWIN